MNHQTPTHQPVLYQCNDHGHANSLTGPQPSHQPPNHQQVIHQHTDSTTGLPPTHWFTNRLSTNPPTHQVNWPPTIWLNRTYFNRGWLVVVGGLSVVGSFVIPWKFQETLKSSISFNLKHILIIIISLTFLLQVV